jgi:hypothetical protein
MNVTRSPEKVRTSTLGSSLVVGEQRLLVLVDEDAHDDPVENLRAAPDDVEVAVGDRIERSGIDRFRHE